VITVYCKKCNGELSQPGAILLSPPDDFGLVYKHHLCVTCWSKIMVLILGLKEAQR